MLVTVATKTVRDRWKGWLIGTVSLGLLLLVGMAAYRNLDLGIYTGMPEAFRSLMNISADADVGSLAYAAMYSSYGALTLAALALSAGSASIAREERNGTIGLLLANPKSRTYVLVSKAVSMVSLAGMGALILWGAGVVTPVMLDVAVGGMHVGALVFHMFVNALFYGFLAMAIGAWTGSARLASGVTAGVMVLSFFAAGLFPVIKGWENVAKAFPWYYFEGSEPVLNGVDWGHLGVLLAGIAILAAAAVVGVNRRDLKEHTVGVTLLDRLRAYPLTRKIADRLAGSTRVSRIWIKTASEHQGLLIVTAYVMFLIMGVVIGPMYTFIDDTLKDLTDVFPEALMAAFGGGDMTTPEGFYQIETFGLMAPIAVMVVTVVIGARALAGEEDRRTMGLLLANPVKRSTIVVEKSVAMVVYALVVGFMTFAGVALGSVIGRLGMSSGNIAAASALATLVGLVFGALALALSAGTGKVRIAVYGAVGAGLVFHLLNAFLPLSDSVAGYARWSPFYYYLTSDPLMNGMHWGHGALLAGLAVALIALSVVLFQRRDLRQIG